MNRFLPFVILAQAAHASEDYQARLKRIQTNQAQIDQVLRSFGGKTFGFGGADSGQAGSGSAPAQPLFHSYGSVNAASLPQGKLLFGKLMNRLIVGSDGSPAMIELDEGQGALTGLRALGQARQAGTPGRISIELTKLLARNGRAVALQATVLDPEGAYGLPAQVLSSKALGLAGSMAGSFVSGLASAQQSQIANPFGFSQVETTGRNALLQGLAQTAADQSKRLLEDATSEKPVLIIDADSPVTLLIQEEVKW